MTSTKTPVTLEESNIESFLRMDRMPHIWCAGCGIGTAVGCFARAVERAGLDPDKVSLISGIGCAGRAAGYVKLDSFHTTHGRALPFATGLKLGNPELNVVVFSGDGDLLAIGGNHLIHSARRNIDLTVICINNFNYGMTGGQMGPTTPIDARTTTTPYGNVEYPFNAPYLLAASGATYVSRWTVMHPRELERSIAEALVKPGFSFVEVLSPCPALYGRLNKESKGLDTMHTYLKRSVIRNGADPKDAEIGLNGPILVGKYVDIERPTLWDCCKQVFDRVKEKKSK
ncbi:MAG TPA: 2-oxoacid:ferredoxin oxidoreductase subunit beta [Dehalococcoidia bacterium]|nr:2-oxoacid:ferredoxin oxidoreductase subunit beta [Dehalococcoidia bacterium]